MKKYVIVSAATTLLASCLVTAGYATSGQSRETSQRASREIVEIADARLKFEINATDGDGGIQVFLDAEQWKRMSIYDQTGRKILTVVTKGIMARQGGTELFLESAEPTFDELSLENLLERWPAGTYDFRGRGLNGEIYAGSAQLTHDIPAGPVLVSPIEGAGPQDPANTVVRWRRVPPPNGSPIIAYQVLVVGPDTGITALPTVTLDVMMPPTATRLEVPPGFLQPNTTYEWEVLAIEAGGNQTLSSSTFTTSE